MWYQRRHLLDRRNINFVGAAETNASPLQTGQTAQLTLRDSPVPRLRHYHVNETEAISRYPVCCRRLTEVRSWQFSQLRLYLSKNLTISQTIATRGRAAKSV